MKRLIPHYIQDQYKLGSVQGQFQAFAMFIDMSGFTRLSENLTKKGSEGAEQLSIRLNNIFGPMVDLVYSEGGFIPYFAGDAFSAIFPIDKKDVSPLRFLQTALALRDLFAKSGSKKMRFDTFDIGLKIGLAFGNVEWGIVGKNRKSFYFRGEAIEQSAIAQTYANNQDIIIAQELKLIINAEQLELKKVDDGYFKLIKIESLDIELNTNYKLPPVSPKILQRFLPKPVLEFNQAGEFRNIISIFISFKDVDNYELLNKFSSIILETFNNFSGYFKEVDFGDKGGVMFGFFGAPVSFENNVERALEFVTAIKEDIADSDQLSNINYRIGITSGIAYTGIVGGKARCQYAAVGNRVNLAARLMIKADWGEVLVDEEIQKTRHFKFKHKGDILYKGIEESIPTYVFSGRNLQDNPVFSGKMVGRDEELKTIENFIAPIFDQQFAGIAYVYGEAGIGKSRLSFELQNLMRQKSGINWIVCQADQILRKPFNPFIYFLRNFFNQSSENTLTKNQKNFETRYQKILLDSFSKQHPDLINIRKELFRTKSVLAAMVSINYDSSLWTQLDAKGKYQNILTALTNLFLSISLIEPLVIEIEDGHWFDSNSREFLREFAHKIVKYPIFILVTSRYKDDGTKPKLIDEDVLKRNNIKTVEIDLNILKPKGIQTFAEFKLSGKIHTDFLDLIIKATNGNPFYAEQILEYFRESNLLTQINNEWHLKNKSIKLSSSINSILMARIDRLSNLVKETVKAAAVIGREFEVPVLSEVMKSNEEFQKSNTNSITVLKEQIKKAERGQIWRSMNELRYIFRHSLLRETVYDMQMHSRLRILHQSIAEAIEKLYKDSIEEKYVDLVFHYEHADIENKTMQYLKKAADYSRKNYQNTQALEFYTRLEKILRRKNKRKRLIKILLKKGTIFKLIGEWDSCEKVYIEALEIARELGDSLLLGRTNNKFGDLLIFQGKYDDAKMYLEVAATFFEYIDDKLGTLKVYGNLGNLYFRQGNYIDAKAYFIQSIALSRAYSQVTTNAQIVANLGLTYMNQGDYEAGITCQLAQLEISKEADDKQGMATLYINLGIVYFEKADYDGALASYEKGLNISEELGNKLLTSIAVGCIGNVYMKKGKYEKAGTLFLQDLKLTEELGDRQGIAIALSLIGELRSIEGEFELAIQYLEKSVNIAEELGYKKGIARATNTLGDVYYHLKKYSKAITCYDRAIEVSREINNKQVLSFSLVEKGQTLLNQGEFELAKKVQLEALTLAKGLGNPDLLFEAKILHAKVAYRYDQLDEAIKILETLLDEELSIRKQADVYFESYKIFPEEEMYRLRALELYQKLYAKTAKHLFEIRIEELK